MQASKVRSRLLKYPENTKLTREQWAHRMITQVYDGTRYAVSINRAWYGFRDGSVLAIYTAVPELYQEHFTWPKRLHSFSCAI